MIQVLYGERGSGTTGRMLDMANQAGKDSEGLAVLISRDNRHMYDVSHAVRYIDASEYNVNEPNAFIGFVCGLLAGNFDIEKIFLLSFPKLGGFGSADNMQEFFAKLEAISQIHHVDFIMNVRGELATAPDFIKPYILN